MTTAARRQGDFLLANDAAACLVRGLRTPIDALRVSIEALDGDFDEDDPRLHTLRRALGELRRVARNVDELVDLSTEEAVRPLRCSAEEIVRAAREQITSEDRERVLLARVGEAVPFHTDGPLLVCALRRLVENALEASFEQVLLVVRQSAERTTFCIGNHDPEGSFDLDHADRAFATAKPDHLGLGLTLAKRDVERMGGSLLGYATPRGDTLVRVELTHSPIATEDREQAA